ncbi:MAG: EscU/YscU/HrcU family type III secretion system export apparatus switch protein [Rickettsia sp.]|nr:EscU/YscU/HrcU family type III secretion system export apparatus switch protein [Rickettsia sp.]
MLFFDKERFYLKLRDILIFLQNIKMPEDTEKESKTEEPTPKKIEKSLERGNSFVSKDLNSFFIIFFFTIYSYFILRPKLKEWIIELKLLMINSYQHDLNKNLTVHFFATKKIIAQLIIFAILILIFIVLGFYIQRGHFIFSFEIIKPNFSKLSWIQGIKRIFSKKNLVDFIKNIFKILFLLSLILILIFSKIKNFVSYQNSEIEITLNVIFQLIFNLLILSSLFTLVIGIIDFVFQKKTYLENLKMTKQEIKEEFKESEGDPLIKQNLKMLRYNLVKNKLKTKIKEASVVITNPTHYAILIKYDKRKLPVPLCLSKSKNLLAKFVKKLAIENKIPIVENPILAQKLYKDLKENHVIPEKYFKEIAKILVHIMYKDKKRKNTI